MCVSCILKVLMGYIVLRNINHFDSLRHFEAWLWSAMETATNIYVRQTLAHRGTPFSCVWASTTKGDDASSHRCNPKLYPCAQDLKTSTTARGAKLGGKKSQLCPQASSSFAHLPVKTSVPWFLSNSIHPKPHVSHVSLTHAHMLSGHFQIHATILNGDA